MTFSYSSCIHGCHCKSPCALFAWTFHDMGLGAAPMQEPVSGPSKCLLGHVDHRAQNNPVAQKCADDETP